MNVNKSLLLQIVASLILLSTSSVLFINIKLDKPKIDPQDSFLNFDPSFLRIISFGHKKLFANLLWIKTLLDSDLDHYEGDDLHSWMYLRFNTISHLDPYFKQNYEFAVRYLSIVKDDIKGAIAIGNKGLIHYPDNYIINYQLGFSYAFELKQYKESLPYFEKTINSPLAPPYIKSLVFKIRSQSGASLHDIYNELLKEYEVNFKHTPQKVKIERELYALKSKIDLKCLNEDKKIDCSKKDFFGSPYIKDQKGYYRSELTIKEYGLNIRK